LTLPLAAACLAACGSSSGITAAPPGVAVSTTTSSTVPSVPATTLPAATTPPTTQAPSTTPPTNRAPSPTAPRSTTTTLPSTVNKANPGSFAGSWQGSGKTLEVSGDESANASYLVGVLCSSSTPAPSPCDDDNGPTTIPGGQLKLHIDEVVTTGSTAVATAEVKDSSDPKHPEGSTIDFTLRNGVITSPIGSFIKQ
jgi:hypothetical protein